MVGLISIIIIIVISFAMMMEGWEKKDMIIMTLHD